MASDEVRKKWGTIFMGEREASVEQLNAMQEHVNRDKLQKERTEDYLERVKARAIERAREILGEAYTERQKVLEEAKGEAAVQKRLAAQECAKIKGEGEALRKEAQEELEKAQAEKEQAQKIREAAYSDGYQEGMNQAGVELHEFRAEMGQTLAGLLRAIERQRADILNYWREDLAELVKVTAAAGTGMVLHQEQEAVLRQMVFQALDLLENRSAISVRVNPKDEETVSDLFRAARERAPELKQWTVTGDESIEQGGLVAESGTGSVDLRRANFREMVDGVLMHLGLPELEKEAKAAEDMARLVEQEVAHIASLTPELDQPESVSESEPQGAEPEPVPEAPAEEGEPITEAGPEPPAPLSEEMAELEEDLAEDSGQVPEPEAGPEADLASDPTLAELEDELFPLEEKNEADAPAPAQKAEGLDPKTLAEGGFL